MSRPSCCRRRRAGACGPDGMPRRGAETVPTTGTIWEWLRGVQTMRPDVRRGHRRCPPRPRLPLAAGVPRCHAARRLRRGAGQPAVGADQAAGAGILAARIPRSPMLGTRQRAKADQGAIAKLEGSAESCTAERMPLSNSKPSAERPKLLSEFVLLSGDDGGRFASDAVEGM